MNNLTNAHSFKHLVFVSLLALASTAGHAQDSTSFYANSEQDQDKTVAMGFMGGAAAGGLVAGPPGAIVGAIFGALVSTTHNSEQENQALLTTIHKSSATIAALEVTQKDLENRYQMALAAKQNSDLMAALLQQESINDLTDFTFHFKTNSSSIENHYQAQLEALAQVAKGMPNAVIEIDAYSDRRGDSEFNLDLSKNRIKEVVNSLQALGIKQQTIQSNAYGEEHPLSAIETLEDNFFDRRVSVRIRPANTDFITQSN